MNTDTLTTSIDRALDIISDPKRRKVLRYLAEHDDEQISLHQLAVEVTDGEFETGTERVEAVELNITTLHHVHLPKLADAGLLSYDAHEKTVRYGSAETIQELLEVVTETMG